MRKDLLALTPCLALAACAATTPPVPPVPADATIVRAAIVAGADACGRGDLAGTMRDVDPDLVLSYPGTRDMGYAALAKAYAGLCDGKSEGTVETTVPEFEEVAVSGDIAIARMIWSTHLRGMPAGAVRKLRDVQVWRRTAAGWRFWRGVHWSYSDEKPR